MSQNSPLLSGEGQGEGEPEIKKDPGDLFSGERPDSGRLGRDILVRLKCGKDAGEKWANKVKSYK